MAKGVRFALGPTMIARRDTLRDVGGWRYLAEFLAEDFVIGNQAAINRLSCASHSFLAGDQNGSRQRSSCGSVAALSRGLAPAVSQGGAGVRTDGAGRDHLPIAHFAQAGA